jgi:elongation factor Tu
MDEEEEPLDQLEAEVRDLLTACGYPGDQIPFIVGSARMSLLGQDDSGLGTSAVKNLIEVMDSSFTPPVEDHLRPLLFAIESADVNSEGSIVVKGEMTRGILSVGDQVEVVGSHSTAVAKCVGIQAFQKSHDECKAGEPCSISSSGITSSNVSLTYVGRLTAEC